MILKAIRRYNENDRRMDLAKKVHLSFYLINGLLSNIAKLLGETPEHISNTSLDDLFEALKKKRKETPDKSEELMEIDALLLPLYKTYRDLVYFSTYNER